MEIVELVEENDIHFLEGNYTKEEVFRKFSQIFVENEKVNDGEEVYKALVEREELGSTAVGDEIAIPHAKLETIEEAQIIISISKEGIEFDAPDNLPVKVIFVVLSPESKITGHLKTLAKISKIAKLTNFKNRAILANNGKEVIDILREEESKV